MKLAEALLERANLKTKIRMIQTRLLNNARVQEGLSPNEDPKALLKELDESLNRMEYLISHINRTNELTKSKSGKTISELIAERDVLLQRFNVLSSFVNAGNTLIDRISHSEIRTLPTFKVADMQKKVDDISKQIRLTDTSIQELNWTTDLL